MFLKRLIYVLIIVSSSLAHTDDLTPIEVKSSLLSNTVGESKYPLSIIGSTDINSTQSIGTTIKKIPGISNADYGAAVGQPVIRGLGGSRVRVLSDNDNVNDLSHISADHPNMANSSNASQIEVIKGPASIFNYGGTTGGIVNVIMGSITDQPYSNQIIRFGRTYDTVSEGYSNNILMKKNIGSLSLYFSHDKRDHSNYDLSSGSLYEDGAEKHTLANSDFADKNLTAGLSLIKDWGFIGFSVEDNKGTYGIAYHAEEEEEEEEEGEHRIFSTHKTDSYKFKGRIDNLAIANSVDFSFNNSNSSIKEHEEDGSFKVLNNHSSSWNLKFNLDNENIKRRLLFNYSHAKSPMSSGAYIPTSDSYDQSVAYFINSVYLGQDVDVAIRYDNNERFTASKSYEDSAMSFSANTNSFISDNLKYSIGYSHVSRSPNSAELFADGKHGPTNRYEKGDSNLDREVSRNIDLGMTLSANDILVSLNLYRNSINNFIYLRDLGTKNYDGDHQDANWSQKNAIFKGYELTLEKSLAVGDNELLVILSRDDISAVFHDDYVPRIPSARNMIDIIMLGKNNEKYSINLIHSEHQKDFDSGFEKKTNSYIDLGVRYSNKIQIDEMYDLNMNFFANNLLDQTRRNHASFVKDHVPLPGSSFGFDVSLDYKF